MQNLLETLYYYYNGFEDRNVEILNARTALQILIEGASDSEDLHKKMLIYDIENENNLQIDEGLKSSLSIVQPKSMGLTFHYIVVIVDCFDDDFFSSLKLDKMSFVKITFSIFQYILNLQTLKLANMPLSKSAKKNIIKKTDFYLTLEELKCVCGSIESSDLKTYSNIFSFNLTRDDLSECDNKKLYMIDGKLFVLSLEEFLDYILLEIENLYKNFCTIKEFSKYQNEKGKQFEILVKDFLNLFYNEVYSNMYYYPDGKSKNELDLLIKRDSYLAIFECKSGTINLHSSHSDQEILKKIDNKVKKAYNTLDNVYKYINQNDEFIFSNKDNNISNYSSEIDFIYIHLSMYSVDSLASNIHTLNSDYISNSAKISLSFEHLLALTIYCNYNSLDFFEYLKKRTNYMLKYKQAKLDVNELDLFFQLMDIGQKSMLNEFLEKHSLDQFDNRVEIISTFHNDTGKEVRPALEIIKNMDRYLITNLLEVSNYFGMNKKYYNYMKMYFTERI